MDFVSYWSPPRESRFVPFFKDGGISLVYLREIIMITGNILPLTRDRESIGVNIKGYDIENRKECFHEKYIFQSSFYLDPRLISRLGNRTKRGGTGQIERVYRARAKVGQ